MVVKINLSYILIYINNTSNIINNRHRTSNTTKEQGKTNIEEIESINNKTLTE